MVAEFRKINILEIHSSFGYAGGQRNMFSFVKYINKSLFQPFAAAYFEGGAYEEKYNAMGIKTISANGDAKKIISFIRENNIDIIHIHRSGGEVKIETEILQGAKKNNPNIIIVEKNVFGKFDPVNDKNIDCSFFQSMMHLNERYLPAARARFNFAKMKVLYNIVDSNSFEQFILTAEEVKKARYELGILETDFVLGRIGRPDVAKWSDLVFEMAPYLEKVVPNFKFVLMGVPQSRKKVITSSKLLKKHFICLEPTSDDKKVANFYQIIDVLGHSSKIGECNGNTINEAMYWGKPVITNSTPNKDNGQLEQIIHMQDGVIANHPQTFARAIEYLYKNPAERIKMGQKGRVKIINTCEPEKIVRRLEKVFVEKLEEKGAKFDLSIKEFYDKVSYLPSEAEISLYKTVYQKKLKQEFGKLSVVEKITNLFGQRKRFYYKVKDFLEHRFGV